MNTSDFSDPGSTSISLKDDNTVSKDERQNIMQDRDTYDFVNVIIVHGEINTTIQLIDLDLLYWVIRAGLLTPLTFARHRLSPLAASGAYFLHNGWQ